MKVVQINAVSGRGSTGTIARQISDMLNRHNIENYIFYADGNDEYNQAVKISSALDMKLHSLMSRVTGLQGYFSTVSTKKLLKRLDETKPDIVHLHNLHHNYINLNLLLGYLAKKGIKTVLTLHDCWFFTGKCTHYAFAKCDRWQYGCGNCRLLKKDNVSWFFDKTKKIWLDKRKYFTAIPELEIVGASRWIADEAKKSYLNCGNITYIHNGINTDIFSPNGDDIRRKLGTEDKFVILAVANKWEDSSNSGLLDFISKNIANDSKIVMLGGTRDGMENVINIPYVNSPYELAKIYRSADVFVNVSHADTLPTVNIEAMSSGTPVVTYDVCGCAETVTAHTGVVVKEDDKEALLDAIKQVKNNGKGYYTRHCREHILCNYDMNRQYEEYLKIYKGV